MSSERAHQILAASDKKVATAICKDYYEILLVYTKGLCKSFPAFPHPAEDMLHEFFLKVMADPQQFRNGYLDKGVGYFRRAIKNLMVDEYRKINIHLQSIHATSEQKIPNVQLRHISTADQQQLIYALIEHVLPAHWIPLFKLYIDGYSYKDIASGLDVPMGTVSSGIARAKTKLADYYKQHPDLWNTDFGDFHRKPRKPGLFDDPQDDC